MGTPKLTMSVERDSLYPRYVEDMIGQLQRLVPGDRYHELRYLLGIAQLAAREIAETIEREKPPQAVR